MCLRFDVMKSLEKFLDFGCNQMRPYCLKLKHMNGLTKLPVKVHFNGPE